MNRLRNFVAAALLFAALPLLAQVDTNTPPEVEPGTPGTLRWQYRTSGKIVAAPALSEDETTLYVASLDGNLYAFDAAFEAFDEEDVVEPFWIYRVGGPIQASPVIGPDGTIYVATKGGNIHAIRDDGDSATNVWERPFKVGASVVSSPAVDEDGIIYFGAQDKRVYALFPDGALKWRFDTGLAVNGTPAISDDGTIFIAAGGLLLGISPEGDELSAFEGRRPIRSTPAIGEDGRIYFGSNDERFYALDSTGGTTNDVIWSFNAGKDVISSPAIGVSGRVYVGTDNRRIFCFTTNGAVVWRYKTKGAIRGDVSIGADGTIFVGGEDKRLYALTPDGTEKWPPFQTRGAIRSTAVIGSDGTIYVTSLDKTVYAIYDNAVSDEAPWPMHRRDAQHTARAIGGEPFIIQQPQSTNVNGSETATFTVVASAGAPITYQWFKNGVAINSATNRTATNATLVIANAMPSDAGEYSVEVATEFGEVMSDTATLTVSALAQITMSQTNIVVITGATIRVEATIASSSPTAQQWFFNNQVIPGATNSILVITNAQITNSGTYFIQVQNALGTTSSVPVTVTVVAMGVGLQTNNVIAAGDRFSAAVVSNQLYTWGANTTGQVGDTTSTNRNAPTKVSTATQWLMVSAGGRGQTNMTNQPSGHALAVTVNGNLFAWGANNRGQLGLGTTAESRTPVQVDSGTNWVHAEAGATHSVALKRDGTMWAWGAGENGQLGNGSTNSAQAPARVGLDSAWVEVRAGGQFNLARRADGTVWAWGRNESGQLGIGNTNVTNVPRQVGTATNWVQISAGVSHSLGLRGDGTLWIWGRNPGVLSPNASTNTTRAPIQVGSETNWIAIDAGADHSLAINALGQIFSWGANDAGQLGNGTTGSLRTPTPTQIAVDGSRTWVAVQAGVRHSLARASDGTVWAWGWNNFGQLGDGLGGDGSEGFNRSTPVMLTFAGLVAVTNTVPTNGAPTVVSQPLSTTNGVGGSASFSVTAGGQAPLAYEWRFNGTNVVNGATNATLTLTNLQTTNAGGFSVIITNMLGRATSAVATLTITNGNGGGGTNVAPVITTQPASTNVSTGGTASFTVAATGTTPLVYQWYFTNAATGTNIVGTNTSLTIINVQPANAGGYFAVVTNSLGRATSAIAILTVTPGTNNNPGTNPVPPVPMLRPVTVSSNAITVPVQTSTQLFVLEFNETLSNTNWRPLMTNQGNGTLTNIVDTNTVSPSKFYRLRVP